MAGWVITLRKCSISEVETLLLKVLGTVWWEADAMSNKLTSVCCRSCAEDHRDKGTLLR